MATAKYHAQQIVEYDPSGNKQPDPVSGKFNRFEVLTVIDNGDGTFAYNGIELKPNAGGPGQTIVRDVVAQESMLFQFTDLGPGQG